MSTLLEKIDFFCFRYNNVTIFGKHPLTQLKFKKEDNIVNIKIEQSHYNSLMKDCNSNHISTEINLSRMLFYVNLIRGTFL